MECLKKAKDAVWFLTPHPCYWNQLWSVRLSNINFAPSLKAYSKMAASARLMYSFQQSWNFSKVSFCPSVKLFSSSSWCLDIYPRSSFICGELVRLSSWGIMFPCHSSFIIFFICCASFSVSITTYHRRERKSSTFSKINPTFSEGLFFDYCTSIFDMWEDARRYKIHEYVSLTFPWLYYTIFLWIF